MGRAPLGAGPIALPARCGTLSVALDSLGTMRAFITAVIAAIEAGAIALAGFVLVAVPAGVLWWLVFSLDAEPGEVLAAASATWQLAHLVPMSLSVDVQQAVALGLDPAPLAFTISLAPLGLTLLTVLLAARSGWRAGAHGRGGAFGLLGGALGFGAATVVVALQAVSLTAWPLALAILVPVLVFVCGQVAGFVAAAVVDSHGWWVTLVRAFQERLVVLGMHRAAVFPKLASETLRLAAAVFAALVALGATAFTVALIAGYVDVVSLGQRLQLDLVAIIVLFLFNLALLPVAYLWAIAWFTGAGFSIGTATSVSPFETTLGPLPAFPILGAVPHSWGGAALLAPLLVVLIGVGVGVLAARREVLRRGSVLAALAVPLCAAVIVGLALTGLSALAGGSIGPGRLTVTGPQPWLVGGLAAAELALGLLVGLLAARADARRRGGSRATLTSGGSEGSEAARGTAVRSWWAGEPGANQHETGGVGRLAERETVPLDPLPPSTPEGARASARPDPALLVDDEQLSAAYSWEAREEPDPGKPGTPSRVWAPWKRR